MLKIVPDDVGLPVGEEVEDASVLSGTGEAVDAVAAKASLINNPENPGANFSVTKAQLESIPQQAEELTRALLTAREAEEQDIREQTQFVARTEKDSDVAFDAIGSIMAGTNAGIVEGQRLLNRQANDTLLAQALVSAETPDERKVAATLGATLTGMEETNNIFLRARDEVALGLAKREYTPGDLFRHIGGLALDPSIGFKTIDLGLDAVQAADPEAANEMRGFFKTPGEKTGAIFRWLRDNQGNPHRMRAFANTIVSRAKSGNIQDILNSENAFMAMVAAEELLANPNRTDEEISSAEFTANVFGFLDILTGAELAIRGPAALTRLARATDRAVVSTGIPRIFDETFSRIAVDGLREGDAMRYLELRHPKAAKAIEEDMIDSGTSALGATPEEVILSRALPRVEASDSDPTAGPSINLSSPADALEQEAAAIVARMGSIGLTAAERQARVEQVKGKLLAKLEKHVPQVDKSIVTVQADEFGGVIRVAVGKNGSGVSFTDPRELLAAAKKFGLAGNEERARLWIQDVETGKIVEATPEELLDLVTPAKVRSKNLFVKDKVKKEVEETLTQKDYDVVNPNGLTPRQAAEVQAALGKLDGVGSKTNKAALVRLVEDTSKVLGRSIPTEGRSVAQLREELALNKAELEDLVDIDSRGIQSVKEITRDVKQTRVVEDEELRQTTIFWKDGEKIKEGVNFYFTVDQRINFNPADVSDTAMLDLRGLSGKAANLFDGSATFTQDLRSLFQTGVRISERLKGLLDKTLEPERALSINERTVLGTVLERGRHEEVWYSPEEFSAILRRESMELPKKSIDRVWAAYKGVRKHQDLTYIIRDQQVRMNLLRGKFGWLRVKNSEHFPDGIAAKLVTGGFRGLTKDAKGKKAFVMDLETGQMVRLSADDMAALKENGKALYKLRWSESVKNADGGLHATDLAVGTKTGITITDLPQHVMKYRPGYITRVYKTSYVIRKDTQVLDRTGRVSKAHRKGRVVAFASNKADAENYINENGGFKAGFSVAIAREADELRHAQYTEDSLRDLGLLYYSQRGDEEIRDVTGATSTVDVFESIHRNAVHAARTGALDQIVTAQKNRILKEFGDVLLIDTADGPKRLKGWPVNVNMLAKPNTIRQWREKNELGEVVDLVKRRDDAIAHINRVNLIIGMTEANVGNYWRNLMFRVADHYSSSDSQWAKTAAFTAGAAEKAADIDNVLRRVNFATMIVWNPVRQKLLQALQATIYAGVDHGFKFMTDTATKDGLFAQYLAVKAVLYGREAGPDIVGRATSHLADPIRNSAKKLYNMTDEEIDELGDMFLKTGIREDIVGHQFSAIDAIAERTTGIVSNNAASRGLQRGLDTARVIGEATRRTLFVSPTRIAKQLGFNSGELDNQLTAWLVARNRFVKRNPGEDWTAFDAQRRILADASNLTLNMNRVGRLSFQEGILGLMFQFMSIQVKMMQLHPIVHVTPGLSKIANRDFTLAEKSKIAIVQSVLFGPGIGLGLKEAYDEFLAEEIPEEADLVMREGIVGLGVNGLTILGTEGFDFNSDSRVNFSERFAPTGAVFSQVTDDRSQLYNIFMGLARAFNIAGEEISVDARNILGPVGTQITKIGRAFDTVDAILNDDDISTAKQWALVAKESTTIFPAMNNFWKGKLAWQTGKAISGSGSIKDEATKAEALARGLFGVETAGEAGVNDLIKEMFEDQADSPIYRNRLEEVAGQIYKQMLTRVQGHLDGDYDEVMMNEKLRALKQVAYWPLEPEERQAVRTMLSEKFIYRDFTETQSVRLFSMLQRAYEGGLILDPESWIKKVEATPDFAGKDKLLKTIRAWTTLVPSPEALEQAERNFGFAKEQ